MFKGKEEVIEEGIITLTEKKKKISNDIQGEEHLRQNNDLIKDYNAL